MLGWLSLELECPEASEHVMLSFPESYWFSGCSDVVMVTLGLLGLLVSCCEGGPLDLVLERPRLTGFLSGRELLGVKVGLG